MKKSIICGCCGVLLVVGQVLNAELPENVPGLVFYASFDGIADGDSEPTVAERQDMYPVADFAVGSPVPVNRQNVELVARGKFGGAVRVPGGKGLLAFDAAGNILAARGTVAFWVQVEQPLWSVPFRQGRMSRLFTVSDLQYPLRGFTLHKLVVNSVDERLEWRYGDREPVHFGREHQYEIIDTRWGADFKYWTFSEHRDMTWTPAREWQPGEWYHIAMVWDAAVGRRLYINGEPAGAWEFSEHRVPYLDKISLGPRVGPGNSMAQPLGLLYDELYIFDYTLDSAAVAGLMRDNTPPRERLPENEELRSARLAWTVGNHDLDAKGIPVCPEEGLYARQVMVDRIRNVRAQRHEVQDGKLHMSWPVLYKDYSQEPLPYVLTLEFDRPQTFNHARLRGSFNGELRDGDRIIADFNGETFTQRLKLEDSFGTATTLEMHRRSGNINLLDLYEIAPLPSVSASEHSVQVFYPRANAPATAGEAAAMAAAIYPPGQDMVLPASPTSGTEETLALAAGQRVHLITAPLTEDTIVTRVGINLALEDFNGQTVVLMQGHDTLTYNRELFEFDMRFSSAGERQTPRLELELREPAALRAGQSFWVSILFDKPGTLLTGPGATQLELHAQSGKTVSLPNLQQMLCDLFLHISEPQVWSRNPAPREQFKAVDEVMTLAEHLMYFDPGNWTAQSIYSWILHRARLWKPDLKDPMADINIPEPSVTGPDWAVWSRESLLALRRHVDWWVDERQSALGEFGGGVNDDSTMVPDWVPFALIHDPAGKYSDSVRRLAELAFRENMPEGLTVTPKGQLHAFEQGSNIIPFLQLLYYGNPDYLEILMKAARWYDGHLTSFTPKGTRHFRSSWVSAEFVPADGVDAGTAILFKPGRYLAWYNGHPEVTRVLREWMDAWLNYGVDPAYPFGEHGIDFATGEPKGAFGGNGIWHHLFWLYELTRDKKYAEPVLEGLRATDARLPGFGAGSWVNWRRLAPDGEVDAMVQRRLNWDDIGVGAPSRREGLLASLRDSVLHMRKYLPIHTWVGMSTDRVGLRHQTAQSMALGGLPTQSKRIGHHYHAVSWEGADYDVARFVVSHSPDHLRVLIYNFHDEPQDVVMRVWRLDNGRYMVRGGVDETGDERADGLDFEREQLLFRHEPVAFQVPSRRVYVLEIDQIERFEDDIRFRPDLALAPGGAVAENGTVRVTVYNIGSVVAPSAVLRLESAGMAVAEQEIPALEAPLDLYPSSITLEFTGIDNPAGMTVVIDPDNQLREITRANNRAAVMW